MRNKLLVSIIFVYLPLLIGKDVVSARNSYRAETTLQAIYKNYSIQNNHLLRETYPFDRNHKATYLADTEQGSNKNPFSYLWPYSGSLSAVSSICKSNKNPKIIKLLESKVLPGLEAYYDNSHLPGAYASYINTAPQSDRFYDDNIWIGLDFVDLYKTLGNKEYLEKAISIWKFIESGTDTILGGGIYWCEQKKGSKNTCSNAPGTVLALKLFEATKDSSYFYKAKSIYKWTKEKLQDKSDFLYYDNINLRGKIGKAKFAYNSGQMLQSCVLLYKVTQDKAYLEEAQNIAKSCYNHFFYNFVTDDGEQFQLLKKGNIWFTAIMFRGFVELYHLDGNKFYVEAFKKNLNYAWQHMREKNGLFNSDWSGKEIDHSKWLLTQFAMVEMYSEIDNL